MKCREFAELVIELARDQMPDAAARAQALSHAELCIGCAARLAEERAWLANVRVVTTALAQQQAPARVEAVLLAALRAQHQHAPTLKPQPTLWLSWRFAAVAAALLLVVGLAGVAWMKFGGQSQSQEALRLPVPPMSSTPPVPAPIQVAAQAPTPVRNALRRVSPRRLIRPPVTPPSEPSAPFYSLVEAGQMAPLESGRIVRIEVPTAELVKLGVPLTETTLTQPVQADLLLGQDGLARAIRFVPANQNARTQE
jgi:hypothetical protein